MRDALVSAIRMLLVLTALTGVGYPLALTAAGSALFPFAAGGSILHRGGSAVGSRLIAQPFRSARYFWPRPSAAPGGPDPEISGGSNAGPLDAALADSVRARIARLRSAGPVPDVPVPVDLVTASASGLDPEITPEGARYQAARVAAARRLPLDEVLALVDRHVRGPAFGVLGEPRVNVLELNLALDARAGAPPAPGR